MSLSIFLWHMLVLQVVRRHLGDWHHVPKAIVALAALVVIVALSERFVVPAVDALLRRLFGGAGSRGSPRADRSRRSALPTHPALVHCRGGGITGDGGAWHRHPGGTTPPPQPD